MLCYLDGTYLQGNATGLTRYTKGLLEALDRHSLIKSGSINCTVFGYQNSGEFSIKFKNMNVEFITLSLRSHYYTNALIGKPNLVHYFQKKPDIIHFHDVFRFSADEPGTESFVTVHDISSLNSSQHYTMQATFAKKRAIKRLQGSQATILADSENTRLEFIEYSAINPKRIKTVHLGVSSRFFKRSSDIKMQSSNLRYINRDYAIYVGRYHPRKNIEGILSAFLKWQQEKNIDLVLVGPNLEEMVIKTKEYAQLPENIKANIHFLGYVTDDELETLYSHALCLVYPSWHEGFGFPVLEAMACGCPAICSTRGSLPEVAGGAAILVEPNDIGKIANEVLRLSSNITVYNTYSHNGKQRAKLFSWDTVANNMIKHFQQS